MLVLTRKPDQTVSIGTDIVVSVIEVRGNCVVLGISAPRDVAIVRDNAKDQTGDGS